MSTIHLNEMIEQYLTRRQWMRGAAAAAITVPLVGCGAKSLADRDEVPAGKQVSSLEFSEIPHEMDDQIQVADGYQTQVVVRWGDPLFEDAAEFDPHHLTAEAQLGQFGYNNDFVAYLPLPRGSDHSNHGLLCVNNEYTHAELMFSGIQYADKWKTMDREQTKVDMAAHGVSVVEIKLENGTWNIVKGKYNRRISALDTRIQISGPAAGHQRMKTIDCPEGKMCTGTINNCAGGVTPWGTVLTCEENFQDYFGGNLENHPEAENLASYQIATPVFSWFRFFRRFNAELEPYGPNLYGWVVEFDPYDPQSVPVKRTSLGRFRHEGATTALAGDGRLVVYSGDDQEDQFFYRFVTRDACDQQNRAANRNLLDHGVLSVARFEANGKLKWLPLVHGSGPLNSDHGFDSQADVVIETRRAAQLLGATPMDRPEDAETNPRTGKVYLMLTKHPTRTNVDSANPRPKNVHGHIVELTPPLLDPGKPGSPVDHGADEFDWGIFLKAGDPEDQNVGAEYHQHVSDHGWLSCPDNCAFDSKGRIWIATDGARTVSEFGDGIYACDTEGQGRALTKQFFRACYGAEVCGPCFTPDDKTMFIAIQHPGESSEFDEPNTRWPDFKDGVPPRPSVVAIRKNDGGTIG